MRKLRYIVVGTGNRASTFINGLINEHSDVGELVGLCDLSQTRMEYYNQRLVDKGLKPAELASPDQMEALIAQTGADRVIVTVPDALHEGFILRAMKAGCDVLCEKPMTTDARSCQSILDAVRDSDRELIVTFNLRYGPKPTKVKETLASGVIGDIKHVAFEWLLDTSHGADYFRRWHRRKKNSGGLLVHKATHHFDLANWCLDSTPTEVFARGSLAFYGAANGNGPANRSDRCFTCTAECAFRYDLRGSERDRLLYLAAEADSGYHRDQCVFSDEIDIEDNASLVVSYAGGATMSYSLVAFSPYEGLRITFTGTKGRLEFRSQDSEYLLEPDGAIKLGTPPNSTSIRVFPQFGASYEVPYETVKGGHGGADTLLMRHLFHGVADDPLHQAANHLDGAHSIMIGIAANESIATGHPIRIADLVDIR